MLKIEHLTKTFGEHKAVDDLSLEIKPGEIYGFIGHNGAGKTTTLKSVVGILPFDNGEIYIDGTSIKADPLGCKRKIAYIPDNPDLYDYMSGTQYLNFIGGIFGAIGSVLMAALAGVMTAVSGNADVQQAASESNVDMGSVNAILWIAVVVLVASAVIEIIAGIKGKKPFLLGIYRLVVLVIKDRRIRAYTHVQVPICRRLSEKLDMPAMQQVITPRDKYLLRHYLSARIGLFRKSS